MLWKMNSALKDDKNKGFKVCLLHSPLFKTFPSNVPFVILRLIRPVSVLVQAWWNTYTPLTITTPLASSWHIFPTLLFFLFSIFLTFSQYFGSMMYVHEAQVTFWVFSVSSLVNSLLVLHHFGGHKWLPVSIRPVFHLSIKQINTSFNKVQYICLCTIIIRLHAHAHNYKQHFVVPVAEQKGRIGKALRPSVHLHRIYTGPLDGFKKL